MNSCFCQFPHFVHYRSVVCKRFWCFVGNPIQVERLLDSLQDHRIVALRYGLTTSVFFFAVSEWGGASHNLEPTGEIVTLGDSHFDADFFNGDVFGSEYVLALFYAKGVQPYLESHIQRVVQVE